MFSGSKEVCVPSCLESCCRNIAETWQPVLSKSDFKKYLFNFLKDEQSKSCAYYCRK